MEARICPQCGHENAPGAAFCAFCGEKLKDEVPAGVPQAEAASSVVFCPKCGEKNTAGNAFCKKCGAQLGTSSGATAFPRVHVEKPSIDASGVKQVWAQLTGTNIDELTTGQLFNPSKASESVLGAGAVEAAFKSITGKTYDEAAAELSKNAASTGAKDSSMGGVPDDSGTFDNPLASNTDRPISERSAFASGMPKWSVEPPARNAR